MPNSRQERAQRVAEKLGLKPYDLNCRKLWEYTLDLEEEVERLGEIVPPITRHHDLAQQLAIEAGFSPETLDFQRCVGAVMRAWRPGKFWEAGKKGLRAENE